jgi:hypothetical protein
VSLAAAQSIVKPDAPDEKFHYRLIKEVTPRGDLVSEVLESSFMNYFLPTGLYWSLKQPSQSSAEFVARHGDPVRYTVNLYRKSSFLNGLDLEQLKAYVAGLKSTVEQNPLKKFVVLNEDTDFQPEVGSRMLILLDGAQKRVPAPEMTVTPFGKEQALIEYKIQQYNIDGVLLGEIGYLESLSQFDDFIFSALLEADIDQFEHVKKIFLDTMKHSYLVSSDEWLESVSK